jgi:hypothetical protein
VTPATLECSHCGDVAVESETGLFCEGDADRCASCGMPGHITIEEADGCDSDCDEGECTCGIASFCCDDDTGNYCTLADCEECAAERAEERKP